MNSFARQKPLVGSVILLATFATLAPEGRAAESFGEIVEIEALSTSTAPAGAATDASPVPSLEIAQVTSVSELSDVRPTDWAFTALQRLVEEYGCIEGYPDRTFRGNRAMSRYEFAAGLNACLDVIVQLIGDTNIAEELDTIRRLQEEFVAELATIRGRVDTLEADVAELEANQFSTTTKLRGQLDAHLVVPFDVDLDEDGDGDDEDEVTFEYRTRLNFDTSFTGEDRLRIRLQASDEADTGTLGAVAGGLADQSGPAGDIEDNVSLDDVYYAFPVGERLSVEIAANSRANSNFVSSVIVPYAGPAVAEFGEDGFYESAFDQDSSFGVSVNFEFTDNIILDLGYSTEEGQDPDVGIFDNYEYIVQLNYLSDGLIDAAVTYQDGEVDGNTVDYVIAGLLSLDFGGFAIGGYYAFIEDDAGDSDEWQVGISVPDFLAAGNELGIYGGVDSDPDDDPVIIEGYYEIGVNEFMTITPAVIYGDLDTGGDDDGIYGVIRTTFRF
ncbi:MAG: iron uptake porin [Cyanobacteria bacterium P01_G01_bin.38]